MAQLQFLNGTETKDTACIQQTLAPLQVHKAKWAVQDQVEHLLHKPQLTAMEKKTVDSAHIVYFDRLKEDSEYKIRVLIVLHPGAPNLDALLEKFSRSHTHSDGKIRYDVGGSGVFGLVLSDEKQVLHTVEAGKFISFPKDTEHWFVHSEHKSINALQYCSTTDGWSPNDTQRPILFYVP